MADKISIRSITTISNPSNPDQYTKYLIPNMIKSLVNNLSKLRDWDEYKNLEIRFTAFKDEDLSKIDPDKQ